MKRAAAVAAVLVPAVVALLAPLGAAQAASSRAVACPPAEPNSATCYLGPAVTAKVGKKSGEFRLTAGCRGDDRPAAGQVSFIGQPDRMKSGSQGITYPSGKWFAVVQVKAGPPAALKVRAVCLKG